MMYLPQPIQWETVITMQRYIDVIPVLVGSNHPFVLLHAILLSWTYSL